MNMDMGYGYQSVIEYLFFFLLLLLRSFFLSFFPGVAAFFFFCFVPLNACFLVGFFFPSHGEVNFGRRKRM